MKRVLATLSALAASTIIANAGQAIWSQTPEWTVKGNTDGWCSASTYYPSDEHSITIGLGSESGWSLFVGGVQSIPGHRYKVAMMATNGASGTFMGEGLNNGIVVFRHITPTTVVNLAEARGLTIQGLGSFSLKGSMRAIRDVMECYDAMTGKTL